MGMSTHPPTVRHAVTRTHPPMARSTRIHMVITIREHYDDPSLARSVRSAHGATIEMEARILAKNDALAARNRAWLAGR
jgi:hypothetical protein